jgi:hypothetical protein
MKNAIRSATAELFLMGEIIFTVDADTPTEVRWMARLLSVN